jgi:propanol-preferring alcohol dehydrogenase
LNGLKACRLSLGDWVAVPGAGGGLGHLAVQYAIATGMRVVGIDTGAEKRKMVEGYGAVFIDFKEEKVCTYKILLTNRTLSLR